MKLKRNKFLKKLKMILQIIAGILLVLILGTIIYVKVSPQFGARSTGEHMDKIIHSPNYREGKFQNLIPTPMSGENSPMWKNALKFMRSGGEREPKMPLQTVTFDKEHFLKSDSGITYSWFGHSTVLLNINGKIILTDPVFSERASPVWFGAKRFNYLNQFEAEQMPELDVILISHDHYDHLDYQSILKLKDKTKMFYVPLGVAAHLLKWGVEESKIVEMDWWQENQVDDNLLFACTPSRHFSGRAGVDKDYTLWCSWVIKSDTLSVYYSGDSGYENHFKQIGKKYGPFDFAMIECGQYNEGWPYIHMMPEQSVQASVDLNSKVMMPIHWGKFSLSLHKWTEPIERAAAKAKELSVNLITNLPGEIVSVKTEAMQENWWRKQEQLVESLQLD